MLKKPPSLFFTPKQVEKILDKEGQKTMSPSPLQSLSGAKGLREELKLEGILFCPDTQGWVVWINGKRIDSAGYPHIDDWTVTSVGEKEVYLKSSTGETRVLHLESSVASVAPLLSVSGKRETKDEDDKDDDQDEEEEQENAPSSEKGGRGNPYREEEDQEENDGSSQRSSHAMKRGRGSQDTLRGGSLHREQGLLRPEDRRYGRQKTPLDSDRDGLRQRPFPQSKRHKNYEDGAFDEGRAEKIKIRSMVAPENEIDDGETGR